MVSKKKPGSAAKGFIDSVSRESILVTVNYHSIEDNYDDAVTGKILWEDEYTIKVFDKHLNRWVSIPVKDITSMGTHKLGLKPTHSNHGSRRHNRKQQFSYKKWWKDDNVQEDTDTKY